MIAKLISGGQTGVDRAALDVALARDIPHGGWCPRGRRAEDGTIPARYLLTETSSRSYAARTEQNVLEADATLILAQGCLRGGTKLTRGKAREHGKPCLVVDLAVECPSPADVRNWLAETNVRVLNVAGPRESQAPGIYGLATTFLAQVLS